MVEVSDKQHTTMVFQKGVSGNPKGRPKGLSITEMVRKKLEDKPNKEDRETYGDQVVQAILDKALKENDVPMLKAIWSYMDGLPDNKTTVEVGDNLKDTLAHLYEKRR